MTEEHKRKIGAANSIALKGNKLSEATRRKIGLAHRGNKHALGMRHTAEWKRAQSIRAKQRFDKIGRKTPAQRNETERRYWEVHKEQKRAKNARSYAKHRAKRARTTHIYYQAHRKEVGDRVKQWRAANRDHCNTINTNRRARQLSAEGSHTVGQWQLLKLQHAHRCAHCRRQEPDIKLTRDHIIPLARGGSNYIENIQPLCGKCNCEKHAKMPGEISTD